MVDADERTDALPQQEEFWKPPTRFGSVPVEKEPLGWDRRKGFRKLFPQVMLPFQVVERVSFGHPKLEPNRLFWGDNLHVMRQLPSERCPRLRQRHAQDPALQAGQSARRYDAGLGLSA